MSDPQKKQVSPMAVAMEATALNEFYRNRVLVLSNELEEVRQAVDSQQKEIDRLLKVNSNLQEKGRKEGAKNG